MKTRNQRHETRDTKLETLPRQAANQPKSSLIRVNQTKSNLIKPPPRHPHRPLKTIFCQTKLNDMNRKKIANITLAVCYDLMRQVTARQNMVNFCHYRGSNCA